MIFQKKLWKILEKHDEDDDLDDEDDDDEGESWKEDIDDA
jgi:hypothetical protein